MKFTIPAGLTPNAVARYMATMHKLALPSLGTVVRIPSGTYVVLGLSSDMKRVKAVPKDVVAAKVVDLPVAMVVKATENAAAKLVTALNMADFVDSTAEAAAYLAKFTGAK